MPTRKMSQGHPSRATAFNTLPIELNWNIAHHLDSDKDIAAFRAVCRQTRDAVDGDNGSFWRTRFRNKFAYMFNMFRGKDAKLITEIGENEFLKVQYQKRSKRLRRGTTESFSQLGHGTSEVKILNILRSLIVDSFKGPHEKDEYGRPQCVNQEHLMRFILSSNPQGPGFYGIKSGQPGSPRLGGSQGPKVQDPAYTAIQVMLGQLLFQTGSVKYDLTPFQDSQKAVYGHYRAHPMFFGHGNLRVNMDWALHCLSFFRHHMTRQEDYTLYETMNALPVKDRPSAWQAPLQEGSYPLSRHWKGTYSYLDTEEIKQIRGYKKRRETEDGGVHYEDKNIEDGGNIQDLILDFTPDDKLEWPEAFESRLASHRQTIAPKTRVQHRTSKVASDSVSIRVQGEGADQKDHFFACGWLNPLEAQHGIPGWQRITFMKHFNPDYDDIESDDLWAYEGVVLPGGRLILGRWWFANDEPSSPQYGDYSGPFILWAVDSEITLPEYNDDEE